MRMVAKDIAAWQSARADLRADADAARWLIVRLVRGRNERELAGLSDLDREALVAGIKDMHRSVYGVPMFGHIRADLRTDKDIAECIDRYAAESNRFSEAIVLAERIFH